MTASWREVGLTVLEIEFFVEDTLRNEGPQECVESPLVCVISNSSSVHNSAHNLNERVPHYVGAAPSVLITKHFLKD